ncbi:hypothetical protein CEXT_671651 [Caerostris extrusa]|uniref:Uncharacterized protein n=1 Tax=Caerostris extrusa TaxID=172846 RepID=A0AAV4XC98_CAEEX|nr:hypothetical protein CEXT_671651 [Caerostris extrusa]
MFVCNSFATIGLSTFWLKGRLPWECVLSQSRWGARPITSPPTQLKSSAPVEPGSGGAGDAFPAQRNLRIDERKKKIVFVFLIDFEPFSLPHSDNRVKAEFYYFSPSQSDGFPPWEASDPGGVDATRKQSPSGSDCREDPRGFARPLEWGDALCFVMSEV